LVRRHDACRVGAPGNGDVVRPNVPARDRESDARTDIQAAAAAIGKI